jgi:hypothetical protein
MKTQTLLHLSACFPTRPIPKNIASTYKKSMNLLKKCVHGAGTLITNHSIAIMSSIGLLPLWYVNTAMIPHDSKYMKHFSESFRLPKLDDDACTELGLRIIRIAESRLGFHLTLRTLENLLCKCYCSVCATASDVKWNDLRISRQPLIISTNDTWAAVLYNSPTTYGKGPLIDAIPLHDNVVNIRKMAQQFDIDPTKLPQGPAILKWSVPMALVHSYLHVPTIVS